MKKTIVKLLALSTFFIPATATYASNIENANDISNEKRIDKPAMQQKTYRADFRGDAGNTEHEIPVCVIRDDLRKVTCYVTIRGGISCLPDNALGKTGK